MNQKRNHRFFEILLLALGSLGCDQKVDADELPLPLPKTTSSSLAILNLDDAVERGRTAWQTSGEPESAGIYVDGLLGRFAVFGSVADLDDAKDVADDLALDARPEAARIRSRVASARHAFAEAVEDLEGAKVVDGRDRPEARAALALAVGRPDDALAWLESARQSFGATLLAAGARAAQGRFQAADELFVAAIDGYDNVSPFPIAEAYFRRGVMWSEQAGRPDLGRRMYEAGLRHLPEHVTMAIHLSELDLEAGDARSALDRLIPLHARSDDPELAAMSAELEMGTDDQAAVRWRQVAEERYRARLESHRRAYLDHASEFFRGLGDDPELALELARENLRHRPTERAQLLVLLAAEAAERTDVACGLVEDLDVRSIVNVELAETHARLAGRC